MFPKLKKQVSETRARRKGNKSQKAKQIKQFKGRAATDRSKGKAPIRKQSKGNTASKQTSETKAKDTQQRKHS